MILKRSMISFIYLSARVYQVALVAYQIIKSDPILYVMLIVPQVSVMHSSTLVEIQISLVEFWEYMSLSTWLGRYSLIT